MLESSPLVSLNKLEFFHFLHAVAESVEGSVFVAGWICRCVTGGSMSSIALSEFPAFFFFFNLILVLASYIFLGNLVCKISHL